MEETKKNYKYFVNINRELTRKFTTQNQVNILGNKIYLLKNERLQFQQEVSRIDKQIKKITIEHNNVDYTEPIKSKKKNDINNK